MKNNLSLALLAASLICSCSPQAYVLDLQMRYPSLSGDDFMGKEMAVIYLDNASRSDSATVFPKAEALALAMEKEYFGGEQTIPVFSMLRNPKGDYSKADSLVSLVMLTGKDVVFLVDGDKVHYYDSMGSPEVKHVPATNGRYPTLESTWRNESYTIIYYDQTKWLDALEKATAMKWQEASDLWIEIAKGCDNNMQMRSCAEYNIALACYMVRNWELALQWLDASDADFPVSLSSGLRMRIKKKAGR